jgi:hypothetical protein
MASSVVVLSNAKSICTFAMFKTDASATSVEEMFQPLGNSFKFQL